jgi:hypothetical protein
VTAHYLFLALILAAAQPTQADTLDSLLADNRVRAGVRAADLYRPLDRPDTSVLCENQVEDYRFLLANLPLSDLAAMTASDLVWNIHLARQAKKTMPWGCTYSQDFFRSFVLPHRVSQEPFVRWRKQFFEEIAPRVKDLSMENAILEVNHWCHEKATYKPTDGRDQDPLTTIRSGFGRCEEEMILTICALRSVGIPARQCYTPYWAHSDDNHAWVEAWADGKWYYLGACEPAQELNQAWFSGPAQRAMLVVSTAYGDYNGDEPVLRRYGRSTLINSTSVYGPTRELSVKVVDKQGKPTNDVRVVFSLWNYGTLMPAMGVPTDQEGIARLVCGKGDWFISAVEQVSGGQGSAPVPKVDPMEDDILFWITGIPKALRTKIANLIVGKEEPLMAFAHALAADTLVTLKLESKTPELWLTECEYAPPPAPAAKAPEVISAEGIARGVTSAEAKLRSDSLFGRRLAWEDSIREANVYLVRDSILALPGEKWVILTLDSNAVWANQMFDSLSEESKAALYSLLRKARGNWFEIYKYLTDIQDLRRLPTVTVPGVKDAVPFTMPQPGKPWPPDGFGVITRPAVHSWGVNPRWNRMVRYGWKQFDLKRRIEFLKSLSDKELRDSSPRQALRKHIFTVNSPRKTTGCIEPEDSLHQELFSNYLLPYRIDNEPSRAPDWTSPPSVFGMIVSRFNDQVDLWDAQRISKFLNDSILVETSIDRLGPPLTPEQCLTLKRGNQADIERLFIAACRGRAIPARRNPVTNQVERWEEGLMENGKWKMEQGWITVDVLQTPKPKAQSLKPKAQLTITVADGDSLGASALYMKDWAVAKWEGSVTNMMEFTWHEPIDKIAWPQELPRGWYLLSSGKRREDGSAKVTLRWFELKSASKPQVQELRVK